MSSNANDRSRDLYWPDCYNVRDLGGITTMNGKETKFGSFVRSDVLSRLSHSGKQMLIDYGISAIIGLRFPDELVTLPGVTFDSVKSEARADSLRKPDYRHIPFGEADPDIFERAKQAGNMAAYYGIWLEYFPETTATVMRAFLSVQSGGVVFHCHSGKDRTGIVAALLLCLAGVPRNSIIDDYVATDENLKPWYDAKLMDEGGSHATADRMESMLTFLDSVGGVVSYLRKAGLRESELAEIRGRLLAD